MEVKGLGRIIHRFWLVLSDDLLKDKIIDDVPIYPLTHMSDQERISPYNINTISSRQVMRIKKILVRGL